MKTERFKGLEPSLEAQRREQVIRAVIESVRADGFDKMTMRGVAERAGVSTGMLVYYFGSKKEMVNAALSEASRLFTERLDENTHSRFGPQRLRLFLQALSSSESEDAPLSPKFLLQVMAAAANDPELQDDQRRISEESRTKLEKSVRAGTEAGEFRDDIDPKAAGDLLYGLWIGWAAEMGAYPGILAENEVAALSDLIFRLFSKPARRAKAADASAPHLLPAGSTPDQIEALLKADTVLTNEVAETLASAVRQLYVIASR